MEVGNYILHRRATTALYQFPKAEQAAVPERLASPVEVPPGEWRAAGVRKVPGEEPLYIVRIDDSLRVIVRAAPGQQPQTLDVFRHETLESFANGTA